MTPGAIPDLGCKRFLVRISRPYQESVCSLGFRLQTQFGYAYQKRVCSNSSYNRILSSGTCWTKPRSLVTFLAGVGGGTRAAQASTSSFAPFLHYSTVIDGRFFRLAPEPALIDAGVQFLLSSKKTAIVEKKEDCVFCLKGTDGLSRICAVTTQIGDRHD